ncbi:MAG: hypothetical protein LBU62_09840, partial [Bacteroidales bacterium]|nr:hypothetical protein [Bacteroidales bacterium]
MKLREIVKKPGYESYLCTVTATDGATCDVTRVLDGKIVKDVRLNATISESDGLVIVPKAESYVLITNIDCDKWFVSQFSAIEKILLNVGCDDRPVVFVPITFNQPEVAFELPAGRIMPHRDF